MRHLSGVVRRDVAAHNFQHMLPMPGNQIRKAVDFATQDLFDNSRIIGHESLRSCDAARCRPIAPLRIISYLSSQPQDLRFLSSPKSPQRSQRLQC